MRFPVNLRSPLVRVAVLALVALVGALAAGPARAAGGPIRWSGPYLGDHTAPFSTPSALSGVTCAPGAFQGQGGCLGVGAGGTIARVDVTPTLTQSGIDHGATLTNVACPAASLCVVTEPTALLTSTNPFGNAPRWTRAAVKVPGSGAYTGITCAGATLCVAWTDSDTIEVSTDPAGGAAAWRAETLPGEVFAVACIPGTTECVASLGATNGSTAAVATSSDPAAGTGGWTARGLGGLQAMTELACPSTALCVGMTNGGALQTSTNPPAGASWTSGQVVSGTNLVGLTCPSATECLAAASDGSALVSPDPAAGASSYTQTAALDPAGFGTAGVTEIACLSTTECLVPDRTPGLATLQLGPPVSALIAPAVAGFTRITGLACPARYQCVGVDAGGGITATYHPARGIGQWYRFLQPGAAGGLNAVSCSTTHFCLAVGDDGYVATTRHPVSGSTAWTHYTLPFRYPDPAGGTAKSYRLTAASCPSYGFCLVATGRNGLAASERPLHGAGTWRLVTPAPSHAWGAVSCPSSGFCVAGGAAGRIAVSRRPLRGGHAWRVTKVASGTGSPPAITAVSCSSASFCLAADARGAVHWSTHPDGGPRAWHTARLAADRLIAVRCRSARFCVAIDDGQHAYATSDPGAGRRAWHTSTLSTSRFALGNPAQESLTALACAPHGVCIAGSGVGAVFPGRTG